MYAFDTLAVHYRIMLLSLNSAFICREAPSWVIEKKTTSSTATPYICGKVIRCNPQ
ncbi:hypothetical protein SAMN04488128_1011650 [Chitinophaga eiseniae]|uniref:Uncharacterized protein n=1 Tax=Chitinophaga eiseniae TaxID=634771 RepID=A0A1T4NLI8_9BACT|nr:hypothetical protein SAMN04488128_1011650 [Chitinophaga eiseniae]